MLEIGPVRVEADELLSLEWTEREVVLDLQWRWQDLPVLTDLPSDIRFRWTHLDDRRGGLPLSTEGHWVKARRGRTRYDCRVQLRFRLHDGPGDAPRPGTQS